MTQLALLGAAIHDGTHLHHGKALLVEKKKTIGILDPDDLPADCTRHDLDGGYLTPGFVDLQVNGGGGVMFNDIQSIKSLFTITAEAVTMGIPGIVGIHLEGPHLSLARKGAHDADLIRPMTDDDMAMITDAAKRLPNVMLTIAPENVTLDQARTLAKAGVILSLGHTDADYKTCLAYSRVGVRCTTHLFNAMSQLGNREPGLVGATLDSGALSAGLIADGLHVHHATIRSALRAKQSPGKIFLVTDAMSCVGSDLTEFQLNGRTIYRRDGALRLSDGTLAGADIDMPASIRVLVHKVGLTPERAIAMATSIPADVLKPQKHWGRIRPNGPRPIYMSETFEVKLLPDHPLNLPA
jgi:N-acetylglucosamine-6-phosphate deacetylase